MSEYEVIIIGGGAAGLSAALVLSRARRRVAVIDAGEPRNARAAHVHGFLSREGTPPADLLVAGRAEVTSYGGVLLQARAVDVEQEADAGFRVVLAGGAGRTEVTARRLVLATGLRDELPDIPGVPECFGRDVLHCPYCHGYEVRDRRLGVIGGSPNSMHQVQIVRQWSKDLVFFAHTGEVAADERERLEARGIAVVEGTVRRLAMDGETLRGVELAGGSVIERDAVFVAPRFVPNGELLSKLGCAVDDGGWAAVDEMGRTSVPGVWVAGNVANPFAQVITAAAEGSAAAARVNADLIDEEFGDAVDAARRGRAVERSPLDMATPGQ